MASQKMEMLKIAAISLTATEDKETNIKQAFDLVRQAAADGADWVQLPECFPFHGSYAESYAAAEEPGGPLHAALATLAADLGIVLFAGTVGERPTAQAQIQQNDLGQKKVFNTAYVFDRSGIEIAKYRKTHLFNLAAAENVPRYCESDGFIPGQSPTVFTVDGWRVGMSVCYDLRFPEFYSQLAMMGPCDILVVPSAFTKATGEAHWQLLLRARAVEWQAYVFAANQCGEHAPGKTSYGHSLICDPWGEVLASTGDTPAIAAAEISRERLESCRARLPALKNRRPELYK